MNAYYCGFPRKAPVKVRPRLGVGLSLAQRAPIGVPFIELRDLTQHGRGIPRLLSYFDPNIDVSIGNLCGVKNLKDSYLGFGVSHRSGIVGSSKLLGNVNGGRNNLYFYP